MKKLLLAVFLAAILCGMAVQAFAECKVASSDPTYTAGQLKDLKCDTSGNLSVTVSGGSVGATATESAPSYTEGEASNLSMDLSGNLRTTLGTTIAGEAVADDVIKVEQRGYYTSITTAATTVVKSGPGWFQGCHVVGGTLGNVTIYDNTAASGAVVVAAFTPATSSDLKNINASFTVGLTVVTAAATNLTCVVR